MDWGYHGLHGRKEGIHNRKRFAGRFLFLLDSNKE